MQKPGHPYVFEEVEGEVAPGPSMSPTLQPVPPLEEPLELDESDLEAVTSEVELPEGMELLGPEAISPLDDEPCLEPVTAQAPLEESGPVALEPDDTTVKVEIPKNPPAPPQLLRGLEEAHKRAGFGVMNWLRGLGGTSLLLLTVFYLTLLASLASSDSGSTPAPADEGTLERMGWWLMETGPVAVAEVSHV